MSMLLVIGGLVGISTIYMVIDIKRRALPLDRREGAMTIHTDQLAEVDAEEERGLITKEDANAARLEIERRILALDSAPPRALRNGSRKQVALLLVGFTTIVAVPLYLLLGSPGLESNPFEKRSAERAEEAEVAGLIDTVTKRLKSEPDGGSIEGWTLLGQTYMGRGQYREAVDAFAEVADRPEADSSLLSRYAEALIAAESGIVTPRARTAIERALNLDETNPAATFYQALAIEQDGALAVARALLVERLQAAGGFEPWMETFVSNINRLGEQTGDDPIGLAEFAPMMRAAPGPNDAAVAAANDMSDEERAAFIGSMVQGLADRLEEEPGDIEGWFRLIRAYAVLEDRDALEKAVEGARSAVFALPETDPRRAPMLRALDEAS
ncbi:MAG: c-type cytochrome biogenesis protein CcmI [Shimia sp.]